MFSSIRWSSLTKLSGVVLEGLVGVEQTDAMRRRWGEYLVSGLGQRLAADTSDVGIMDTRPEPRGHGVVAQDGCGERAPQSSRRIADQYGAAVIAMGAGTAGRRVDEARPCVITPPRWR
jgi:hypothetical protein